jgi:hypothetical protein
MLRPMRTTKDVLVICCLVLFGLLVLFVLTAIVMQFLITSPT